MFKQNSSFKLLVVGLGFSLLTACDADTPTEVTTPAPQQPQQVAPPASSTAIFLPGGAGIDFGKKPIKDRTRDVNNKKFNDLTYLFEVKPDDVIKSIDEILLQQSFSKRVRTDTNYEFHIMYDKKGQGSVETIYSSKVHEGFNYETKLRVRWYD